MVASGTSLDRFQFLGIPPKGEHEKDPAIVKTAIQKFPISRDPPEGGTGQGNQNNQDDIRIVSNF